MGSKDALLMAVAVGNDGAASSENLDLEICGEILAGEVGGTKLDSGTCRRRCVRCVALSSEMSEVPIFA